ncbi:UNVERIFIED_CONTAM: Sua5/YciO/YrdC/YwlC family protein, partial [Salmonella enterica subsp. enterica serovar Weltevreden]
AVARIFTIKQRSESKSLIILVSSIAMLREYIADLPQNILNYLQKVTEPTTIIYENPQLLAKNVIASDNTVAIRLVQDPFCQQMIAHFGKP